MIGQLVTDIRDCRQSKTMNRAYSILEIKSLDADLRMLKGWATTPTPDRLGDVGTSGH